MSMHTSAATSAPRTFQRSKLRVLLTGVVALNVVSLVVGISALLHNVYLARLVEEQHLQLLALQQQTPPTISAPPAPPTPPTPPLPPAPLPADYDPARWESAKVERHVMVRDELDALLADPSSVSREVRVVPAFVDGRTVGMKLYGIRATSRVAALGLQNGDTLVAVNGHDVASPDHALEAYAQLKDSKGFVVDVLRRGEPVRIEIGLPAK